jgi:predicted permease
MWIADSGRELRQGLRALASAPGFALGVILSLTLGIVANTAAFSFINAVAFRPFPGVRDQHELVRVTVSRPQGRGTYVASTYAEYETLAAGLPGLTGLAAYLRSELALTIDRESSAVFGAVVSRNYFEILGAKPSRGRFFGANDGAEPVVVISHDLWRRRFREDAGAVGQTVLVNGASVTIVGVAPPEFQGVEKHFDLGMWLPAELGHLVFRDAAHKPVSIHGAGNAGFRYVGRRRPGVAMATIGAQAAALQPVIDSGRASNRRGTRLSAARVWMNDPTANLPAIIGFMVAPLLVLILACVNAGNLLLARASRQRREWEVRLALGASRWRVVRQVLIESLVLATVAAAASLLATAWLMKALAGMFPVRMPVDVRVQIFTILVTLLAALAFGLGPALRVARSRMNGLADLRSGYGPARSRVRATLIALQAALSLGLLATGAQFVQTVRATMAATAVPGADRLMIAGFNVESLEMDPAAADDFYARLLRRTAALEGVVTAGLSTVNTRGTFGDGSQIYWWHAPDDPPEGRGGLGVTVSGRYFEAVRAPLVAGRYFTSADETATPRTAIVSEGFARRYLSHGAPGTRLRVAAAATRQKIVDVEVVGVVGTALGEKRDLDIVFFPAPLTSSPARSLYVQFDDSGRFTLASLQEAVAAVNFRVPVRDAGLLRDQRRDTDVEREVLAGGVAALGIFALALAAGGLYGVVTFLVALRRREIGVRLALGATSASVVRLVLRQGLVPAVVGAALGAGGAAAIGILVRSRLHGATPVDPAAFALAAAVLLVALLAACIVPARHAARIDPAVTLRSE